MDYTKAIELIEKATYLGLVLPQEPGFDALASAEILALALEKRGKTAGLISRPRLPIDVSRFSRLGGKNSLPKDFIVSLDTAHTPISQMRYEKSDGRIDVIFSPKEDSIKKENISFREGKLKCDCIVALGVDDIESVELEAEPGLLKELPIINFGIASANKKYGEVNLVDEGKSSYAEAVYDFVSAFSQEPLAKEQAELVLSAIIKETKNFSVKTSADTLLAASELMRLGAELKNTPEEAPKETRDVNLIQLIGRASVRSKLDERGVLWSFLTTEDFEKTKRSPADLPVLIEHIEGEFPSHRISSYVWQNPDDSKIYATLAGNRKILATLEERGVGKFQSPHLLLSATFETFRHAEEILTSLLENAL